MQPNLVAEGLAPLDMAASDEFASLRESADDLGIPVPATSRYLSRQTVANGLRFHYLEWGDPGAPPVILLHGGNQSAHSWDLVSLALAGRYHVFALDQRGHGDSELARHGDYTPAAMARDAARFIEAHHLERPIVFGHSMGGIVTMVLLRDHPGAVGAAVLVDVAPQLSEAGVAIVAAFVSRNREFSDPSEFVERVVAYDPFRSRAHIERTAKYNLFRRADGMYLSKADRGRHGGGRDAVRAAVLPGDLDGCHVPILLVRGEQSPVLDDEVARAFAGRLPRGDLVLVSQSGHNVHSQNTAGFLAAVEPFLARQAALLARTGER